MDFLPRSRKSGETWATPPFLDTVRRRDLFLSVLEQMRRRYRFAVLGYVIMPEHVYLLVSAPQRLWQSRFYDFNIGPSASELRNCATCIATR